MLVQIKRTGVAVTLAIIFVVGGLLIPQPTRAAGPVPPTLDGLLDPVYLSHSGRAIEYEGFVEGARATLYVMEDPSVDSTYIWLAWIVARSFNDASYGTNKHSSWPSGHEFDDLLESDLQRLDIENRCGEVVLDATMDLLDGPPYGGPYATPSGYNVNMNATESIQNYINGGDWNKMDYDTSLAADLNDFGYCVGGDCSVLGTDLTTTSPPWADDPNYIPASPYDDWEYSLIWELRVERDVFVTAQCPQGGILGVATNPIELHASPPKTGESPVPLIPATSAIGDYVWLDIDRDGVQDVGEPGISNVTLTLYSDPNGDGDPSEGSIVANTVTDATGHYLFNYLGTGKYLVDVTDLNGRLNGLSMTVGTTDPHGTIFLKRNDQYLFADFGYAPSDPAKAAIGDYIWSDADNDGIQDPGEPGIGGVTLQLLADYDMDGSFTDFVATTTTAGDGTYLFMNLQPGTYVVDVTDQYNVLSGYSLTSGPQSSTDPTSPITVYAGDIYLNADFGYYKASLGTIGNLIWYDEDGDGYADAGELGVGDVSLSLIIDANGNGRRDVGEWTIATVTAANGSYQFTGLDLDDGDGDADYLVTVTDINHVLRRYRKTFGSSPGSDNYSQPDPYAVALTAASPSNQTADFGYWFEIGSGEGIVGDYVWYDLDGDGVQDTDEAGAANVALELWEWVKQGQDWIRGNLVGTTSTDINGYYFFSRLDIGQNPSNGRRYQAEVIASNFAAGGLLEGFTGTNQPDNMDESDALYTNNTMDLTLDFGYQFTGGAYSIGDYVWYDADSDGVQDGGESGITDVTLELYADQDGDGVVDPGEPLLATDTTDASGNYLFSGLINGDYIVLVTDDNNRLDGYSQTYGQHPWPVTISGANRLDIDFGYVATGNNGSIGDLVWVDTDEDGIQDGGEIGLEGVTINLYRPGPDGQPGGGDDISIDTTSTDASGNYLFDGLPAGDYFVEFVLPSGYVFSPQDQGGDDSVDSDASPANGWTAVITLVSGENDLTWDAGLVSDKAALGDFVWDDLDADGIQDSGETGVSGVTVRLYDPGPDGQPGGGDDTLLQTTTTDSGGFYGFSPLDPDDYFVEFVLPGGYSFSPLDQGGDDSADSDANTSTGRTAVTSLVVNETDPTWDAGIYQGASIGDYLWVDTDGDGIQDGGESGYNGATVRLYDPGPDGQPGGGDDTLIDTTSTAADGSYNFTGLTPGDYFVEFVLPGGYAFTPQNQGGDDTLDSDANTSNGRTAVTTLTSGESDTTWDGGIYQPASLGDYVWVDSNANGVQDDGATGLNGVPVSLYDPGADGQPGGGDDTLLQSTATAGGGAYSFTGLAPGDYFVQFTLPAGYVFTLRDQGGNDATDSDAHPATGNTIVTTLVSGENDTTWDTGLLNGVASIGDYVWEDTDIDGIQDSNESAISNVWVTLYTGGGAQVGTTTTDANGYYYFTNLAPGNYYLIFQLRVGYDAFSPQDQGGDDTVDSDPNTGTGQTATTALVAGQNDTRWDAGMYRNNAALGDYVWEDTDGDGIQDTDESGVSGVTVNLYDPGADGQPGGGDDTLLQTTTTNSGGAYSFTGLTPGSYFVEFVAPGGYSFISPDQGGDDYKDSDANTSTGRTITINLGSGEIDNTWDAGIYQPAAIGNYVWNDADHDGIQDGGEAGINGVTVNLYDCSGTFQGSTSTASGGLYSFTNLAPGEYYVEFVLPGGYIFTLQDQGADDTVDSDADPATGRTICTSLSSGETDNTWDAGLDPGRATIGNYVWVDTDMDGVQDGGESGLDGVLVRLYNSGDVLQGSTTTASGGYYSFSSLVPGDYYIEFVLPGGYVFSPQDQGGNDNTDSDANTSNGQTIVTTLSAGETDNSWDAGIYRYASISNYVWEDVDNDGIQDGSESGVGGVTVNLYDPGPDGQPGGGDDILIDFATTNGNGGYIFTNLIPGDYFVEFVLPSGYIFSPQDQGSNEDRDSDANSTTGRTIVTSLSPGENDPTWDAGLHNQPTAVKLLSFTASAQAGHILIAWETESEYNNLGFNLYRREIGTEEYILLNEALIPSQAPAGGGAAYSLLDKDIEAGVTYEYLLEDVNFENVRTQHGPIQATGPYSLYFPVIWR
jgi:hypothetical protein